ncbi:MAG TPA: TlpA disulfide reductase family protein [Thermoanaerobaculia bacterium]|nr:TlpA disulfide reductase family protein [Thermoanaerobaculia bacterium]
MRPRSTVLDRALPRRALPRLALPRLALPCLALLALVLLAPGAGAGQQPEPLPADLTVHTIEGEAVRFGDLRGKVVLLDFWATWCGPCRDAAPHLARLDRRMEGEPFEMIGISVDTDRQALERYLQTEEVTWTQVWDSDRGLARWFGVEAFPTYLVIDHEGRPAGKMSGWGDLRRNLQLDRTVQRAVRKARKAAKADSSG